MTRNVESHPARRPRGAGIGVAAAFLLLAGPGQAGDFIYQPVNPSFGGFPGNSSHLYQGAEIHNAPKRKRDRQEKIANPAKDPFANDPLSDFTRTLQSRLLSGLADKITEAIYGANPQGSGTFVVDGTTVSFKTVGSTIQLVVTDGIRTTQIALPRQ
jgi:curli production assembly/transport component CsgF